MSLDITLLQVIKQRDNYDYYAPMVKGHLVDDTTMTIIKDFGVYFEQQEDKIEVDFDLFPTWFKQFRHPNFKQDKLDFFNIVFDRIQEEADSSSVKMLTKNLQETHYGTVLANMSQDLLDGKIAGDDFLIRVQDETEAHEREMTKQANVPWDTSPLEDVITHTNAEDGLPWGLSCLNSSLGRLTQGDFVVVAAYVDSGKTSFLTSQIAEMAKHSDRPILYFNNESVAKRIRFRMMQSTLRSLPERIYKHMDTAEEKYNDLLGGPDKFRVVDCHGWHITEIERVVKRVKPALIIFDMLDNVRGFEAEAKSGTVDMRLELLYQKAREIACKYCPVIATSQLTGEANGMERPEMHMLKGSRVAKQGAADAIIMIGRSLDSSKQNARYIYTPKNKLCKIKGADRGTNTEVIFDIGEGVFRDPEGE